MQYNMADEEDERNAEWPKEVDEFFYRELLFAKHEGTVTGRDIPMLLLHVLIVIHKTTLDTIKSLYHM